MVIRRHSNVNYLQWKRCFYSGLSAGNRTIKCDSSAIYRYSPLLAFLHVYMPLHFVRFPVFTI